MLENFMMKLPLAALNLVGKALQEQMHMQVDDKAPATAAASSMTLVVSQCQLRLVDLAKCFVPNRSK